MAKDFVKTKPSLSLKIATLLFGPKPSIRPMEITYLISVLTFSEGDAQNFQYSKDFQFSDTFHPSINT